MQLHQPQIQKVFLDLEATLLVVSFSPLEELGNWAPFFRDEFLARSYQESGVEMPGSIFARTIFLADPELTAYHAYGLGRISPIRVLSPKILWQYVRWLLKGKLITKWYGDPFQRGGDFVIGPHGLMTLAHAGRNQGDRPSPNRIIEALGA